MLVDGWGWNAMFACWIVAALLALAATIPLSRSEARTFDPG
jgi:sugar phosphate permease